MKKLGYGMMRLPLVNPDDWTSEVDLEKAKAMVDLFMERGFTYFDTAHCYGHNGSNERAVRECVVKRYPRDSFTITDKIPVFAMKRPEELAPVFAQMLERCGVEYFDYLWLHALSGPAYENAKRLGAFEFAMQKKEEGRAKHIGFSFHGKADVLDTILTEHPEMEYVQLQINYIDWEDEAVQSRLCYEVCEKHDRQVIVMEPVKGGSLVDIPEKAQALLRAADPAMSNASWAIRFAATPKNVLTVLSGMSTLEQVEDNTAYMADFVPLTGKEQAMMQEAAGIIRENTAIPCTACRYCTSVCPKGVDIPDYFSVYNTIKRFGEKARLDVGNYYANLCQTHGTPGDCVKCGQCEDRCPQHLPIRDLLEKVDEELGALQ